MNVAVIIPYRGRGDTLRERNLIAVKKQWSDMHPFTNVMVCSDGREGDEQFNRSAAYNVGIRHGAGAEVFVFAEADMLISRDQVDQAVWMARSAPGMVVPFTEYRYLGPVNSEKVALQGVDPNEVPCQWTKANSIGALGVCSRQTLDLVGRFDEAFEGSWYDDDAMKIAFEMTSGPFRFVEGPAHHLYHLPGWQGNHLTAEDKRATARNRKRLKLYERASGPSRIRALTAGGI